MYACKPPHFPLCNEALQKGPIHRGIYWYIMNHLCCIPSSKSFFHILHPTRKQQRKITDEKKQRKLQAALGREQSFELCTHTHAHSEPLVGSTYTHAHNEPLVGSTRASYVSRGLTNTFSSKIVDPFFVFCTSFYSSRREKSLHQALKAIIFLSSHQSTYYSSLYVWS